MKFLEVIAQGKDGVDVPMIINVDHIIAIGNVREDGLGLSLTNSYSDRFITLSKSHHTYEGLKEKLWDAGICTVFKVSEQHKWMDVSNV